MKNLILLFVIAFALANINFAQETQKVERGMQCDQMLARFDGVIGAINAQPNEKKAIVIVYLGKGEKTRIYNQKRLQAIRLYFVRERKLSPKKLILAEGENRNGLAKLEFYVNGELYDEFYLSKKGSVCISCCGE